MKLLKYTGKAEVVEVSGYGHFGHGDEKSVDDVTAGAFMDPRCAAEGWEVRDDGSDAHVQSLGETRDLGSILGDNLASTSDDQAHNVEALKTPRR